MPARTDDEIAAEAEAVLRANDRGRYTVPSAAQYPHAWAWDGATNALGVAMLDRELGWQHLDGVFDGQHASGMVPHITFHPEPQAYFPGPERWGDGLRGRDGRQTSGISNPPIAGTTLRVLFERTGEEAAARMVLPKAAAWIDWWMRDRVPDGVDEPVAVHPWEPGRDNAPELLAALRHAPAPASPFRRRDLEHVPADQRPSHEDYECYIGLVDEARELGWDQPTLARSGSFRVLDPALSGLLAAAAQDLADVADALGDGATAERQRGHAERVVGSLNRRARRDGVIPAVDLVTGESYAHVSVGQALAAVPSGIADVVLERARSLVSPGGELHTAWGVRTAAPSDQAFQRRVYWRGPVWTPTTWLLARGFERHGEVGVAAQLDASLVEYGRTVGMYEYADPFEPIGLGAPRFSWPASFALVALGAGVT